MRRFTAADLDIGHVPVTQGLAPAPSLLHALVRECRDMGPTLSMEVTCIGSLGPSRCIGVGWLRPEYSCIMLCYGHEDMSMTPPDIPLGLQVFTRLHIR